MTVKKKSTKGPAADWRSPGSSDALTSVEQIAHAIVSERPDVLPSVERIMRAELSSDDRTRALNLFGAALHTPGDVHRDPKVAIERCGSGSSSPRP